MSNETDHAARIAGIEKRLDAATPGEWIAAGGKYQKEECVGVVLADNRKAIIALCGKVDAPDLEESCNTAELIANAPADLRYLLDRVRDLEARVETKEKVIRNWMALHDEQVDRAEKAEADRDAARTEACISQRAEARMVEECDRLRAELARLDEPWVECREVGGGWQSICNADGCYHEQRTIRVVQPQEGDRHE